MTLKKPTLFLASLLISSAAFAQAHPCALDLQAGDLDEANNEASANAEDFKQAFARMTLDNALQTSSTVGATLMGSALANETAATVQGLRHLVVLRDNVDERGAVVEELNAAMKQASGRMRRIADSYVNIGKLTQAKDVQALAAAAASFSDVLSRQWVCR